MSLIYFYVPDERTIGRCEESEDMYHHAQIYRHGQWEKAMPYDLICNARPIEKEEAIQRAGLEVVEKD